MLAPWQRLDAFKTFLYTALNFAMRCGTFCTIEWQVLDNALRPLLKHTLYLPKNASNDYLYGSSAGGAVGLPQADDTSDACRNDAASKLLSSTDAEVRTMALEAVQSVTSKRLRREAEEADVEQYLNGATEGDFCATSTELRSVWTEARKASRQMGVTWELQPEGVRITTGAVTLSPKHRRKVMRTLRQHRAEAHDNALKQLPNQEKVMEYVAADRASSHFMRTGKSTRFTNGALFIRPV